MFQLDWYDEKAFRKREKEENEDIGSFFNKANVAAVGLTFWAEHCLECAPPLCYKSCENYSKRADGRCRRTEYGLKKEACGNSLLGYGVRLKFRCSAKLETKLFSRFMTVKKYCDIAGRYEDYINRICSLKINRKRFFNSAGYFWLNKVLAQIPSKAFAPDLFLLELYSLHPEPYKMLVEAVAVDWAVVSRASYVIAPGFNSCAIEYEKLISGKQKPTVLRIYPENNLEAELILYTADFVKLKDTQVKCVVWDLDNTIWEGVLSEAEGEMALKKDARAVIEAMDKRGILQTIASKNDYDIAWPQLERLGISNYFLYPAINWGQKSKSLEQIAKKLNIGLDTFAFIDDSPFERAEVQSALPEVRVYPEVDLAGLLKKSEFEVPVTAASSNRRELYRLDAQRNEMLACFDGAYLDFLSSLEMKISISPVDNEQKKDRCYELLQRTNQLNLTGRRYTNQEYGEILFDKSRQNLSVGCVDKLGDYGTIAFISVLNNASSCVIAEMAVSCRAAKRHIEHTLISWLATAIAAPRGLTEIYIAYKETCKNKPMLNALVDIGFTLCPDNDKLMRIDTNTIKEYDGIISVEYDF